jgi:hypothetical protein
MRANGMALSGDPLAARGLRRIETLSDSGTKQVIYKTTTLQASPGRKEYQEYKKLYGKIAK